jgi:hypothetical protein
LKWKWQSNVHTTSAFCPTRHFLDKKLKKTQHVRIVVKLTISIEQTIDILSVNLHQSAVFKAIWVFQDQGNVGFTSNNHILISHFWWIVWFWCDQFDPNLKICLWHLKDTKNKRNLLDESHFPGSYVHFYPKKFGGLLFFFHIMFSEYLHKTSPMSWHCSVVGGPLSRPILVDFGQF